MDTKSQSCLGENCHQARNKYVFLQLNAGQFAFALKKHIRTHQSSKNPPKPLWTEKTWFLSFDRIRYVMIPSTERTFPTLENQNIIEYHRLKHTLGGDILVSWKGILPSTHLYFLVNFIHHDHNATRIPSLKKQHFCFPRDSIAKNDDVIPTAQPPWWLREKFRLLELWHPQDRYGWYCWCKKSQTTSWGKGNLSHYLQGFIHPRWCRISSINSSSEIPRRFTTVLDV